MRTLISTSSVFAVLCLWGANCAVLFADAAPVLPRYSLPVGRRLIYSGRSDFKYDGGAFSSTNSVQLTVVSRNADGSSRVIVRSGEREAPTTTLAMRSSSPAPWT